MGMLETCELCGADESSVSCGECEQAYYCCSSHQEADWEHHKDQCQPTVIEQQDPMKGRYLVAGHDVKAGELLFKEKPIALGPRANSRPVCLGCHKLIQDNGFPRCPKCLWPLCSPDCASSKFHEEECSVLAEDTKKLGQPINLAKTPRYDVILVLRCLLLRCTNPKDWKRFLSMASHAVNLVADEEIHHMATMLYIKDILKVNYDPKVIHHTRAVIIANCFEWTSPSRVSMRGVYPKLGRINHSCLPNVTLSSDGDGVMYARAAVDMKGLKPLSISYTGATVPTWERQAYLNEIHYFNCNCERCDDPTELGLYYSSPKCDHCNKQYLESKTWLGETKWECPLCHNVQSDFLIKSEYFQWLSRFDCNDTFIKSYPKGVRNILERVELAFHPKHHVWVMAAQVAIRTLTNDPSRDSLNLRSDLWKRLLKIFNVLEPGMTRRRGMTLYELGICEAELTRVLMKEGRLTDHFYNVYLREALEYLQEAIGILCLEPLSSNERQWYTKAIKAAETIVLDMIPDAEQSGISPMVILENADPFEKVHLEIRNQ